MSASTFFPTRLESDFSAPVSLVVDALRAAGAVLARVGQFLATDSEQRRRQWEQEYLEQSGDLYELEFRERALSRGAAQPHWMSGLGQ
jgi:hypothetical protein